MFDTSNRKFKIGDNVRVRDDLQVGKKYYTERDKGDIFTYRMRENLGKEARIINVDYVGYKLDIDPIHTYTEEMLEEVRDVLAESEYTFNEGVDHILNEASKAYYRKRIDEALDSRMFEDEPKAFQELIEEYKKYF